MTIMIDSRANETVSSDEKFPNYELWATDAVGTRYFSAAENGVAIVNKGEKVIDTVDANGVTSQVRIQMCSGLNPSKILGSVSRLVQARHRVVFQDPKYGSYIQNVTNGYRVYLRQENGSYYLDLWVKKTPVFTRQCR